MKQEIETQLKQILKEYLGEIAFEQCSEITSNSNLKNDFGLDSLDFYAILMDIENYYDFSFSSKDEECIVCNPTLGNVVDIIYEKIK